MGEENQAVTLVTPDRRRIELSDAVDLAIRRSTETGEAVGFCGHTITCPYFDIGAAPECYTCEHDGFWDEPCKLGIPQNPDYSFSKRFEDLTRYCDRYQKRKGIVCDCGMLDSELAEID